MEPKDKIYFKKKFKKKHFEDLFEFDFKKTLLQYKKHFQKKFNKKREKELIIEMLYQLGPANVFKFKKMFINLEKKRKYMVCLEMMNSLWYKQTPRRVENLINNFISN